MSYHSCKQAATLLTRSIDGSLGWFGRLSLALHLRSCSTCPNIHRQLLLLRDAARHAEQGEEPTNQALALRKRIKEALQKQGGAP
jgi:predicted ATP-dependent Lon-type protease